MYVCLRQYFNNYFQNSLIDEKQKTGIDKKELKKVKKDNNCFDLF